jgi:group II intron reverse transcriptase/maturase
MRNAETVLGIIHDRGRRGLPLSNVYRQLYNPALYLRAYGRLARNRGALTPGGTAETADRMTQLKIQRIITALRQERYRWTPVRRTFVATKGTTKKRPLGLPTWSDKLVQEVVRSLLEAYYEPQFRPTSHGFRPGRGCHTALQTIYREWTGTHWFIEGDIAQCFDRLDHAVLLAILGEQLHDRRFLRLVAYLLRAGYLAEWTYHPTLSGVPQGRVVSPLLANVYLDRLDRYVETTLLPAYSGPRAEAETIKQQLQAFLHEHLRLALAEAKTLLTHARTERAHFLGYEINTLYADHRHDAAGRRSVNGQIGLHVPRAVCRAHEQRCRRHGKPTPWLARLHDTPFSIVAAYQHEYRGVAAYYQLAQNRHHLDRLKGVMEASLVRTLATKLKTSSAQIYRRYHTTFPTAQGPRRGLQVTVAREKQPPLVARWGGVSLARRRDAVLNDHPGPVWSQRTELLERLLADTCELCGATSQVEVHHIRHLKTIQRPGRSTPPVWVQTMLARQRKTLVTCRACHQAIHAGRPTGHAIMATDTGEPDPSKGRRPVRRGADAKVPA